MKTQLFALIFICLIFKVESGYSQNKTTYNQITDHIYVLNYGGTNYTIATSNEGLLIIDTGYPAYAAFVDSSIRVDFKMTVKYVFNTHYHYDHVGGNQLFAKAGAIIIAHENTRNRMLIEWNIPEFPGIKFPVLPPYNEEYLPDVCIIDSLRFIFGNEVINLLKFPSVHTDSDVAIWFRNKNLVVTGDIYAGVGFPPFELTINEYLTSLNLLISMCNKKTIVVPGHGKVTDLAALILYRKNLIKGVSRIKKLKTDGKTIEEIVFAEPLRGLMEVSQIPESIFIYCVLNGPINE